jgi:peptidoglycan/LPS O-acetylase OafA/YrhL
VTPQPHSPAAGRRLPELDLLRFLAAMAVVGFHFLAVPIIAGEGRPETFGTVGWVARYGYLGVELFFLISGFVIVMSAQKRTARSFLVHRGVRLYPAFWAAVLLSTSVIALLGRDVPMPTPAQLLANLTMLPNYLGQPRIDEVYWTLAVELKFYALIALALALGLRQHLELLAGTWLAGLVLAEAGIGGGVLRSVTIFPYGSYFVAGLLLFKVHQQGWTAGRIFGIAVAFVLAEQAAIRTMGDFIRDPAPYDALVVRTIVALCFALVAFAACRADSLPRTALWSTLGAFTYPVYLCHSRIGRILFDRLQDYLSPLGAILVEALLVGIISWVVLRIVEQRVVSGLARSSMVRWLAGEQPRAAAPDAVPAAQ